jgi:DNA-directed RNA polymerase specialized sigma subunit
LSVLPARELLALHAFYLQEQNVDEARVVLGLSRPGFYRLLSRARGRLRRVLSKQEIVQ